jgi:hypothetical protein
MRAILSKSHALRQHRHTSPAPQQPRYRRCSARAVLRRSRACARRARAWRTHRTRDPRCAARRALLAVAHSSALRSALVTGRRHGCSKPVGLARANRCAASGGGAAPLQRLHSVSAAHARPRAGSRVNVEALTGKRVAVGACSAACRVRAAQRALGLTSRCGATAARRLHLARAVHQGACATRTLLHARAHASSQLPPLTARRDRRCATPTAAK